LGKGERGALVSEFNCLRCLVGVDVDADCSPDRQLQLFLRFYAY
jgi:hypothetical protein